MKRLLPYLICCALFSMFQPAHADAQPIALNAATASVNADRLKRIDTLVQRYIDRHWLNGAVTLVVKDNQLVQYKGYGYLDAEAKTPMPKDAVFRIASQTKAITSVGILMLYEQGRILLDEPVADFIPEFRHPVVLDKFNPADSSYTTVAAKREITFRDLLTHSSGSATPLSAHRLPMPSMQKPVSLPAWAPYKPACSTK